MAGKSPLGPEAAQRALHPRQAAVKHGNAAGHATCRGDLVSLRAIAAAIGH
jgi:hypothetical protein